MPATATVFNSLLLTTSHTSSCEVLSALRGVRPVFSATCLVVCRVTQFSRTSVCVSLCVCVCLVGFLFLSPLLKPRCSMQLSANRHSHPDTTVLHTLSQIRILNPWWLHTKKCKHVHVCVSECVSVFADSYELTLAKLPYFPPHHHHHHHHPCQSQAGGPVPASSLQRRRCRR